MSVAPVSVETNQKYKISAKVKNIGAAEVPARSTVTFKTDNDEITLTVPEAIGVGEEKMVTAEFVAPATAMVCSITAECNANRAFAELQTVNNSASAKFEVTSPYTMTVTTDKNAYNIGETVHLAGKIISSTQAIAGIKVEPYVMYHGARTALEAVTDADGSFAVDYALSLIHI